MCKQHIKHADSREVFHCTLEDPPTGDNMGWQLFNLSLWQIFFTK